MNVTAVNTNVFVIKGLYPESEIPERGIELRILLTPFDKYMRVPRYYVIEKNSKHEYAHNKTA